MRVLIAHVRVSILVSAERITMIDKTSERVDGGRGGGEGWSGG